MSTESAVWARSLSKVFRSGDTEVPVFQELSVDVCQGERLAVIGESGSGKSTLLHLLGGLDRPTNGEIHYGVRNIVEFDDQALADFRNAEVGFVWQNPSLLPEFTAVENVAMPLLIRGVRPSEALKRAAERLTEVGLRKRLNHRSGELSGGEQQRVALARAIVSNPKVLLADELTGSLDAKTGEAIMRLLDELHRTYQLTSIFVTHNLSLAAGCDRVLELRDGSLRPPLMMDAEAIGVVQDATRPGGGFYV